jgi:hypothetical protein
MATFDNHLEKLLEGIFPSKFLFLPMRKYIESLGVALRASSRASLKQIK